MAHPAAGSFLHTAEKAGLFSDPDGDPAVFPLLCPFHLPAEEQRSQLHPVADTENGNTGVIQRRIDARGAFVVDAGWTAGKDDPLRAAGENVRKGGIPGNDFGIDVAFTDTAGDQLGVLAAEVQDQNQFLLMHNTSRNVSRSRNFRY